MRTHGSLRKVLALGVALTFSGAVSCVEASETVLCNSCNDAQIWKVMIDRHSAGPFFVQNNDARSTRYFEATSGKWATFIEKPLPQDAAQYWALAWQIFAANGNSFTITIPVVFDADLPDAYGPQLRSIVAADGALTETVPEVPINKFDAWKASEAGYYQDYVKRELNNASLSSPSGFWVKVAEKMGVAIPALAGFFGIGDPSQVKASVIGSGAVIEARFKDGSSMKFAWDPYTQSFEAVRRSAIDSSGNQIPIIPKDVIGPDGERRHYYYPESDLGRWDNQRMSDRLLPWGIDFPRRRGSIGCTSVGDGPVRCE